MTTPSESSESARRALLDEIAAITTMRPGTLAEEWRERPGPAGEGVVRLGPYYKHQVWKDGRNISRRVSAAEAGLLREDIDNARRFGLLTGQLAELNIGHTLALRAAEASRYDGGESKKTPCGGRPRAVRRDRGIPREGQRHPGFRRAGHQPPNGSSWACATC